MLQRLHLVRHGEVDNPDRVVYAMLDGFGLSTLGRFQAGAAAEHLAHSGAGAVVTSPLQRAVETAQPIAGRIGVPVRIDDRLTEWGLAMRWAGVAWADLVTRFPGELEAYLATPADLPFAEESLHAVAVRMMAVVASLDEEHTAAAIIVSHQDPVQALRLALTGRDLHHLGVDKPGHATVVTLHRAESSWIETATWSPPGPSTAFPPVGLTSAPSHW